MKYKVRKFGNRYYRTSQPPIKKSIAIKNANVRRNKGQLARVVKVKGGYDTFWAYPEPPKNASSKRKKADRDYQKRIKNLNKKR